MPERDKETDPQFKEHKSRDKSGKGTQRGAQRIHATWRENPGPVSLEGGPELFGFTQSWDVGHGVPGAVLLSLEHAPFPPPPPCLYHLVNSQRIQAEAVGPCVIVAACWLGDHRGGGGGQGGTPAPPPPHPGAVRLSSQMSLGASGSKESPAPSLYLAFSYSDVIFLPHLGLRSRTSQGLLLFLHIVPRTCPTDLGTSSPPGQVGFRWPTASPMSFPLVHPLSGIK